MHEIFLGVSQGGDTVKLKIQLSHLNEKKCKIVFQENSLELQFQTRSATLLLNMYIVYHNNYVPG